MPSYSFQELADLARVASLRDQVASAGELQGDLAGPLVALAGDAGDVAAARTRRSVRPDGGRREGAITRGAEALPGAVAESITNAVAAPGRAWSGGYATAPSAPGMWSDEDEARSQLNQSAMRQHAFDLAGLTMMGGPMVGAEGGAVGIGPVRRIPANANNPTVPEPLGLTDRNWQNYGRRMTANDVLSSEAVWGGADRLAAEGKMSRHEAFATLANDMLERMGEARRITPQQAMRIMGEQRGIGLVDGSTTLGSGATDKKTRSIAAGANTARQAREKPDALSSILGEDVREPLFDRSLLTGVPDVPQRDLPRYAPARGVPARVQELTSDRGVRDKVGEVIDAGIKMGGKDWYNAEPLRLEFVRELGADRGNQAFGRYMDYVAATSPRSEVGVNARNASYYYSRMMQGQGMPEVGTPNPAPYGHIAQRLHQMNAERVSGAGWDPLNNPKPASFAQNLTGNQAPVTVDTHAFRLPGILSRDPRFLDAAMQGEKGTKPRNLIKEFDRGELTMDEAVNRPAYWATQPKENEYAAMERFYKELAKDAGITPAQAQAAAWVGGGKTTGLASDSTKPFIGFLEDRIYKTAAERGMDPREVLRRFIRGELPLLGVGGVAAAGALQGQDQARQ